MNETLNLAEILKDCPKGTKLYSPIFGDVYLDKIRPHLAIVVTTDKEQGDSKEEFLYDGRYGMKGECMLFPSKGKNTWEGFVPPCDFKDGDVIYVETKASRWVSIFKEDTENVIVTYADSNLDNRRFCGTDDFAGILCQKRIIREIRLATEEEKQKLFQAIKYNGHKWNAETKTLEKLAGPKFDPATLKPFDQVLVRDALTNKWCIGFFEKIDTEEPKYDTVCSSYRHCIPYNDETKHLLGKAEMEPEYYRVDEYE